MICDRPKCKRETTDDWLYCSEQCYGLDNDPTPVTVVSPNKAGGFGHGLHWSTPDPVHVPYVVCLIKKGPIS